LEFCHESLCLHPHRFDRLGQLRSLHRYVRTAVGGLACDNGAAGRQAVRLKVEFVDPQATAGSKPRSGHDPQPAYRRACPSAGSRPAAARVGLGHERAKRGAGRLVGHAVHGAPDGRMVVREWPGLASEEGPLRWNTVQLGRALRLITVEDICYLRAGNKYVSSGHC
jgi:hypothetical protein